MNSSTTGGSTGFRCRAKMATEFARYGLTVAEVMEVVSAAIGGEAVTQVIEGNRRFDVYLRMAENYRSDAESIGNLWITTEGGARVPLSQVADIVNGTPKMGNPNMQTDRSIAVLTCSAYGEML
jgi:Cu/Ag efflux pump CusA